MSRFKYEGSVRKSRQLAREIENRSSYENLTHSIHKLLSFLKDEVPGWKEDMAKYDREPE